MKQIILSFLLLSSLNIFAQNLQWVNGISSPNNISSYQVVVDSDNNVYEVGRFNGMADFDPSSNVVMLNSGASTSGNVGSIYVSKQDANGNLLWAKVIGAVSDISLQPAICVDNDNNIYITGIFFQTVDFNPDAGIFNMFSSSEAYFLTKWDTNGVFQWATQFCAGVSNISMNPLAIAAFGSNVFVTGTFTSSAIFELFTNTFPTSTNNVYGGYGEVFVVSINTNGTFLNWAKTFGNPNDNFYTDRVKDLIIDNQGNLYITGLFSGTFDANPGSGVSNISGSVNEFTPYLVKLNSAGNYVAAKSFLNASEIQIQYSSMQNTIVLGGQFKNTLDVAINSGSNLLTTTNDIYNAFFCSYSSDLMLNWAKIIDGGTETFNGITIDNDGNTYVTGAHTSQSDLDVNLETYYDPIMGAETNFYDCYLIKLNYFGETTWIRTFNHCYAAIPLFKKLISTPNGNFLGVGYYINNAVDYNLSPNASSALSLENGYASVKALYDACAIMETMPLVTGPESADAFTNITLSVENIPVESFIDWLIPEDWQITNTTPNAVSLQTGNTSGNITCIVSDLCGNTTPINFYILINDPNNPNTGEYSFRLVKDIHAVSFDIDGSRPKDFTALNDMTYFIAEEGSQLWKTDGTESGTTDVLASTDITAERIIGVFQNKLVIIGEHPTLGEEIWLSNGTASGTTLLTEIIPGLGYPNFSTFTIGENYMYFLANNNTNGQEWWVTNGTAAGTYMVVDLSPSAFFGLGATPVFLGDAIAFGAIANTIDRKDLWIIGPNQGQATNLTEQFPALYYTGLNVSNLAVVNNLLFFDFYSGNEGDELFISDGTVSGTFMYELFPGNTSAYPEDFMVIGNTIIMNAYTAQYPQGCMVFIDENLISNEIATRIAVETDYAEFNGIIYFSGYESSTGNELWRTDGTPNGTWLISDILPGAMGSSPDNLTWCGSKLYFTANSGTLSQPHVSNGTADGTFMLADLFNNGTVGSFAHDFTFLNGNTFFIARTGFIDFHIFKTDGTVSGTEQIFAQDATNFSNPLGEGSIVISNPGSIHLANNSIWMSADYHGISKELYVIDDGQINHITDEQIVASRISIDVYPNPTETFLNITSNDDLLQEIIIFDMTGRTIYQERCNQNSRLVDVSKLASGTYLLTTSTPLSHQSIVVIKK